MMGDTDKRPVRIYLADVSPLLEESCFQEYLKKVSEERREKVLGFRFREDQARSLAAGLLLMQAVRELGIDPETMQLRYGENDKPELADHPEIAFNLSHSGMRAMCVIGTEPIGCDVEEVREKKGLSQIASHFFAEGEKQQLAVCLSEKERQKCFYRIWTMKESYLKRRGTGLSEGLQGFTVNLQTMRTEETGTECRFYEYDAEDDYCYSLCTAEKEIEKHPRFVFFIVENTMKISYND